MTGDVKGMLWFGVYAKMSFDISFYFAIWPPLERGNTSCQPVWQIHAQSAWRYAARLHDVSVFGCLTGILTGESLPFDSLPHCRSRFLYCTHPSLKPLMLQELFGSLPMVRIQG